MKNYQIEENLEILENKVLNLLDEVENLNLTVALVHGQSLEDQVEEIQLLVHSTRELYEAED